MSGRIGQDGKSAALGRRDSSDALEGADLERLERLVLTMRPGFVPNYDRRTRDPLRRRDEPWLRAWLEAHVTDDDIRRVGYAELRRRWREIVLPAWHYDTRRPPGLLVLRRDGGRLALVTRYALDPAQACDANLAAAQACDANLAAALHSIGKALRVRRAATEGDLGFEPAYSMHVERAAGAVEALLRAQGRGLFSDGGTGDAWRDAAKARAAASTLEARADAERVMVELARTPTEVRAVDFWIRTAVAENWRTSSDATAREGPAELVLGELLGIPVNTLRVRASRRAR
ncbi:MAG: hypothetical protein K1X94_29395 [Sandaracinaceae bacterium]|nr:hypothetical protein [Sandaracinaceae bacterium]